eukprot:4851964-Pyramimonas_sp.AAC.1
MDIFDSASIAPWSPGTYRLSRRWIRVQLVAASPATVPVQQLSRKAVYFKIRSLSDRVLNWIGS